MDDDNEHTMTTAKGTPTKLPNGNWGAKVNGTAHEGDVVAITTKAGKTWYAEVTEVVSSGNGVSICATESI